MPGKAKDGPVPDREDPGRGPRGLRLGRRVGAQPRRRLVGIVRPHRRKRFETRRADDRVASNVCRGMRRDQVKALTACHASVRKAAVARGQKGAWIQEHAVATLLTLEPGIVMTRRPRRQCAAIRSIALTRLSGMRSRGDFSPISSKNDPRISHSELEPESLRLRDRGIPTAPTVELSNPPLHPSEPRPEASQTPR